VRFGRIRELGFFSFEGGGGVVEEQVTKQKSSGDNWYGGREGAFTQTTDPCKNLDWKKKGERITFPQRATRKKPPPAKKNEKKGNRLLARVPGKEPNRIREPERTFWGARHRLGEGRTINLLGSRGSQKVPKKGRQKNVRVQAGQ